MFCPLCSLIKRVSRISIVKKPWKKKIKCLVLKGEEYFTGAEPDKCFKEVVRYFDGEFLFVNSVRAGGKLRDVVVCMPVKHINKFDLRKKENQRLLMEFDAKILEFIKKEYKSEGGSVRVFENFGRIASVPGHAHKQIIYTKSGGLRLNFSRIKYD